MLAPLRSRPWVAYGAAIISILVVWAASSLVDPVIKRSVSFNCFFLAVSLAAWLGGLRPALFTAAVSCVVGHYYFTHPYGSERINGFDEFMSIATFLLVGTAIGILGEVSLRALERARIAERVKDELMATVAHELCSPLTVIHYANALDRISSGEPARDHIDLIDEQVQQLNRMIQDLLDVSRVARGKIRLELQNTDVATIVNGAVVKARPTISSRKHSLTVSIPDHPIEVSVDEVRLEQVLANILINAAKYTPDGGQISLQADVVNDSAIFKIRDNGIGISKEMLPRVFDLFTQVNAGSKSSEGGLGIGLALVRKIVEMHDGSVQVTSAGAGCGSEFTVTLPLAKPTTVRPNLVRI